MREGDQFGSYQLEERIAIGGMAEVFRARRIGAAGFARQVCIKRILESLCAERDFVEMFIDEARTGAQLRHGNIVAIDDFGEVNGQYFLCMELVSGVDLSRLLVQLARDGKVMPVDVAVFIAGEVLKGLDYAHRKLGPGSLPLGIVHRDISPHNVMVSFSGEVKITDFGIAKASSRLHQTVGQMVKGKIAYMAPEQARGGAIDGRADLFAAGVVLFEVLAGRRPFSGKDETEIALALVRGNRESIAMIRPDVPPALVAVVDGLLAVVLAERFASATDALAAITPMQRGIAAQRTLAAMLAHYFPGAASAVRSAAVFSPESLPAAPTHPKANAPEMPAVVDARTDASGVIEATIASDPAQSPVLDARTEIARPPFDFAEPHDATHVTPAAIDLSGRTEISRSRLEHAEFNAPAMQPTREHTSIEPLIGAVSRETSPTDRTRTSFGPKPDTEAIVTRPAGAPAVVTSARPAPRSLGRTVAIAVFTASLASALVYVFMSR